MVDLKSTLLAGWLAGWQISGSIQWKVSDRRRPLRGVCRGLEVVKEEEEDVKDGPEIHPAAGTFQTYLKG